jgi:DNA-binding XRE family transcriptional regulator
MNTPSKSQELATRRRRLGASRETMAAGLGLSMDAVKAIEDGVASEPERGRYDAWLGRIEAWPADVRARQFHTAGQGRRFDAEGHEEADQE